MLTLVEAYAIVGVPLGAGEGECKASYRTLRSRYFRAASSGDKLSENQFRALQDAIALLEKHSFPDKDRVRLLTENPKVGVNGSAGHASDGPAKPGMSARDWYKKTYDNKPNVDSADASGKPRPIKKTVRLSLEEAAFGVTVELRGKLRQKCSACNGERHVGQAICDACSGSGFTKHLRAEYSSDGTPTSTYTCGGCSGSGTVMRKCLVCAGTGQTGSARNYKVRVRIPGGVRNGADLILRGAGEQTAQQTGLPGEMHIKVEIKHHEIFRFTYDGVLSYTLPVSILQCLAEEEVTVPTLWGKSTVLLKPGISTVELVDGGFPDKDGVRGPLRLHIEVIEERIPQQFLEVMRRALDDMRIMGWAGSKHERAFTEKVERWRSSSHTGGKQAEEEPAEQAGA